MHALLLALACSGTPSPSADGTVPIVETTAPPESRDLVFAFRPRGVEGAIPSELALNANLPLFPKKLVGKPPPAGTSVVLDPPVEGELVVTDRATLVFRPTAPLAPGATYTVRVDTIGTLGATEPDWKKTWVARSAQFTTPPFGLVRAGLQGWDVAKGRAEVRLTFAGPVDLADVQAHTAVRLAGADLHVRQVLPGPSAESVVLHLDDAALRDAGGGTLAVDVRDGVALRGVEDVHAPVGAAEVPLVVAPAAVTVRTAKVREGADGFYVDVYCDDGAVPTKRWWWDRETWSDWEVSTRCELDAPSAAAVHLSTPGAVEVVPADSGFRVFGDLPFGPVSLRIDAGARTVDGGVLAATFEAELDVPHRDARVDFVSTGRYLPRAAWKNLGIRHTNVPDVEVEVRHVPAENLVFWLGGEEAADGRVSDVVARKRIALAAPMDQAVTSWIDVHALVPDAGAGVYQVAVRQVHPEDEVPVPAADAEEEDAHDTGWSGGGGEEDAETAARLVLTDMHLLAKLDAADADHPWSRRVHAWAVDVQDNHPLAGVDLALVRPSGKTVARCATDATGGCAIDVPTDPLDPTPPIALIARRGGDLTYLAFADLQVDAGADVQGEGAEVDPAARASVWTDRGVYRPGDVAHVGVLVRGRDHRAPKGDLPVLVRVYDPRGKELRRQVADTNEAGMLAVDQPFGSYAATGRYRVAAEVGGIEVGDTRIQVEEFVPERLRVQASADRPAYRLGDPMAIAVDAAWLFGGSAVGEAVEVDCQIEPTPFTPTENATFHYGPAALDGEPAPRPITLGTTTGTLDADGKATLTCPTPDAARGLSGPARLVARAAVFEGSSGRTTVATANAAVHPDTRYVGLRAATSTTRAGETVELRGVVVDWGGKAVPGDTSVAVEVVRVESEVGWVWNDTTDSTEYRRMMRRAKESARVETAHDGTFTVTFVPKDEEAAGYLVSAAVGGARTELYLPLDGHRWWWSSLDATVDQTPRPQAPSPLVVTVPANAKVGAPVEASITAPYAGRVLWTVESAGVIRTEWAEAVAGPNRWSFTPTTFEPNVYVSALLLKDPHLESDAAFLPDRAFGVASVPIEPTAFTLPVKLIVPADAHPNGPLNVSLDLGALTEPAYAAVYAVDEGILSLTRFPDPDPAAAIFARRALGVKSFETVGWTLLFRPGSTGKRTGGDAGGDLGRVQMVKPVALWSGLLSVPSTGKLDVSFDVPSYRGALRVMAVAATASKMGHASASVPVREPLVLQTTLPRFLVEGDRALVPVEVTNLSGAAQDVRLRMEVTARVDAGEKLLVDVAGGGLPAAAGMGGAQEGTLHLAKDARGTLVFQLVGQRAPGSVGVSVTATAGRLASTERLELPVVAAEPEVRETVSVPLSGETDLSAALTGWRRGSDRTTVWITRNPYGAALTRLRELLRYPHGCIEQTTSTTRPLLYVKTLAPELTPDVFARTRLEDMVQHGIDRVVGMQTPRGGFSYWPGGTEPNLWGSIYATHFLLDARDGGYPVPAAALDDAVAYLDREASGRHTEWTWSEPYALYLLARAGRPRNAQAHHALEGLRADAAEEDRYLLQAAIWQGGDHQYERALRAPPVEIRPGRYAWSYRSDLRQQGLILAVFRDLFGPDPAGDALAGRVAAALTRSEGWSYTTQELAWGLTGLAKSIPEPATTPTPPTLTGPAGPVAGQAGATGWTWSLSRAAGGSLRANGAGLVALVTTEGNRIQGSPTGDHGLSVSREWLDANGQAVRGSVALGTPLYVRLTLENTTRTRVADIALTDRIPAGFEIENPRLGRGGMPDWVDLDSAWAVDSLDVRDDRLSAYGAVDAGASVTVIYEVRAVTAGQFTTPEVSAAAMYDPALWSRVSGGPIRIDGRWAGSVL